MPAVTPGCISRALQSLLTLRQPHSLHLAVDMDQQKGQVQQHTGPLLVSCVHYSVAGKSLPFLLLSPSCSLEIAKVAAKPECRSEALHCHSVLSSLIFQGCQLGPQEKYSQEDSVSLVLVLPAGFVGPSLALSSCLSPLHLGCSILLEAVGPF